MPLGLSFVSINAKTGNNINKIFYDSLCYIIQRDVQWKNSETINLPGLESEIEESKTQDLLCEELQVKDYN